MNYPKDWGKVTCNDWCEDERSIWLCLGNKNAICEIDKKSKNVKILGSFPHNGLGEGDLSLSVKRIGDYIIFCPFKANDVAILHTLTGELEFIDVIQILNSYNYSSLGIEKFYRMISYRNYIYFFGIRYPVIMRLDMGTKRIELFDEWVEEIERNKCKNAVSFTDGYAQKGNKIYLPIGKCSGMLKVNLDTLEWEYIKVIPEIRGILGMVQDREFVWFTGHDVDARSFFQWNLDNDKFTQIDLPCQDAFYAPLYYKKSLLFFRNYREKSYRYEIESERWEDITSVLPRLKGSDMKKIAEEEINFFSSKEARLYHWNYETKIVSCEEYQIREKEFLENSWVDYCERCRKELKAHVLNENKIDLKRYIEIIGTV